MKNSFGAVFLIYPAILIIMIRHIWIIQVNTHGSNVQRRAIEFPMEDLSTETEMNQDAVMTQSALFMEVHLLTLFTTFNSSMEKLYIYNNTLHGWLLMKPKVVLVLFSDDDEIKEYSKSIGWDLTLNVGLTACNGTPVLKDMFLTVQKLVNSKFYAYANADILFNHGLLSTLEALAKDIGLYSEPLLLTGKRSDLLISNKEIAHIRGESQINSAFRKSRVSYGYAEDYFVVNNKFPWDIYPDLVIGRAMVDNYLSFIARRSKVTVIDASATVGALHQKTKKRKKSPSTCNKDILGELYARRKISRGNVECFPLETRMDFDGSVFFMKRGSFTTVC